MINVPAGFADNTDNDTTYSAGTGLTLSSTTFSVNDLAGDVTGPPNATVIANGAITSAKIAIGAVSGGPSGVIATNSITQGDIAPDAIGSSELDADSVGESEIKDNAVTTDKIFPGSVNSDKITDGTITAEDIANFAIENAKIDTDAVSTDKILNGTILNEDIAAGANIDGSKINPVFTTNVSTAGVFISSGTTLNVPDYVFQKYFLGNSSLKENYDFQTLAQIEAFVKSNHHLPGIKSAEEVKLDGFWNLSESNLQNLEKIEELFLHTIEQEKKIDQLKTENESLSAELQSLRKDMEEIKALLKNKD